MPTFPGTVVLVLQGHDRLVPDDLAFIDETARFRRLDMDVRATSARGVVLTRAVGAERADQVAHVHEISHTHYQRIEVPIQDPRGRVCPFTAGLAGLDGHLNFSSAIGKNARPTGQANFANRPSELDAGRSSDVKTDLRPGRPRAGNVEIAGAVTPVRPVMPLQ